MNLILHATLPYQDVSSSRIYPLLELRKWLCILPLIGQHRRQHRRHHRKFCSLSRAIYCCEDVPLPADEDW